MVIGAPDVDQLGELALELVAVIGDVGGEIGQLAVALDHRAVLVVAELGRAIPLGAVLRIEQAAPAQAIHRLGHFTALAHRLLAEKGVESNAELAQLPADRIQQGIAAVLPKELDRRFFVRAQILIAVARFHLGGNLFHVIAGIAVFGKLDLFAERFPVARVERQSQILHLVAGVVDVVFPFDVETGRLVQARQDIADHRHPAVAHVQRTGRIDAGELDLHLLPVTEIELRLLPSIDCAQLLEIKFRRKSEI